jgi:hypothetical protein
LRRRRRRSSGNRQRPRSPSKSSSSSNNRAFALSCGWSLRHALQRKESVAAGVEEEEYHVDDDFEEYEEDFEPEDEPAPEQPKPLSREAQLVCCVALVAVADWPKGARGSTGGECSC